MTATAPLTSSPRQRVIDAAVACFARNGFHGASMQQICAEASMSPGALYRYFPSKVSIIAAIAEAEREQHKEFFERLAQAEDPVEAMVSIGADKLEQMMAHDSASLCAEVIAEAARNPEVRGMFDRNLAEARGHIMAALRRGQAKGMVDPDVDIETACHLIMAMTDGLSIHKGLDPGFTAERIRPVLQRMLRSFFRPTAALVLLLAVVLAPGPAAAQPRPPSVTVVAAARGPIVETATLTGTLVPRNEVLVSPRIDGVAITEILAEQGDRVTQGQVLARLSRELLDAAMAQNAAQLAHAEGAIAQAGAVVNEMQANREQADLALARTRDLLSTGNAAREVFEQRQAASRMMSARVSANENARSLAVADRALALAQRQELQVRLDRTELRAPVAGIVSRRIARLGAVVSGAGEPLFRIIQDGAVELEADVPEKLLAQLRPGQPARVVTVDGPRTGHVRLVSPEVNRATRLGQVRVALDAAAAATPVAAEAATPVIGSFARAVVEVARRDGVLAPLSAVLFQPNGAVVQVVHDGVVETRPVAVGLRNEGKAEITTGLNPGEAVVALSGTFIRGGDRVTAVPAAR